jgi:hypothetical protein
MKTKNQLANWATKIVTLAVVPFLNSIALNLLYIVNCYGENRYLQASDDDDNDQGRHVEYCKYLNFNIVILVVDMICFITNLLFCIPYNID